MPWPDPEKAKELKSLALTAAEWAKRKNMGEEAIQHCRSYALEAERKMGQMLKETERAKGVRLDGKQKGKIGGNVVLPPIEQPTLATLGPTGGKAIRHKPPPSRPIDTRRTESPAATLDTPRPIRPAEAPTARATPRRTRRPGPAPPWRFEARPDRRGDHPRPWPDPSTRRRWLNRFAECKSSVGWTRPGVAAYL